MALKTYGSNAAPTKGASAIKVAEFIQASNIAHLHMGKMSLATAESDIVIGDQLAIQNALAAAEKALIRAVIVMKKHQR